MNSILAALMATGAAATESNKYGDWDIDSLLGGLNTTLRSWGGLLVVVIGLVMVIVAVIKIAKGLISHGKTQTNWVVNIILFFLGGALCFGGGWNLVAGISEGGDKTLQTIGEKGKEAPKDGAAIVLQLPDFNTDIGDELVIDVA